MPDPIKKQIMDRVLSNLAPLKTNGPATPAQLLRRGPMVPNSFSIIQMGK